MVMLMAVGPNEILIPCMIFNSKEEAVTYLETAGCNFDDRWGLYLNPVEDKPEESEFMKKYFFTSYYAGCGGVSGFTIEDVEIGKPLTNWNLD